jgi:hypothetical protein
LKSSVKRNGIRSKAVVASSRSRTARPRKPECPFKARDERAVAARLTATTATGHPLAKLRKTAFASAVCSAHAKDNGTPSTWRPELRARLTRQQLRAHRCTHGIQYSRLTARAVTISALIRSDTDGD